MSGLFDKGTVGEARLSSAASVEDDFAELDTLDLLSTLEKDSALDLDVFDMDPLNPDPKAQDEGSADFMEVFTDLTDLLGGVPGGLDSSQVVTPDVGLLEDLMLPLMPSGGQLEDTPAEGRPAKKRSAAAAALDAPSACNPDHDDYTAKRPRVATADSTSEVTPEEDVPRPSTSTSPEPSTSTDLTTKYVERRIKNNIASRRSRQTRKQKFIDMEVQAEQLEEANDRLRQQVAELEKLTKVMKDMLVQKLAKGS